MKIGLCMPKLNCNYGLGDCETVFAHYLSCNKRRTGKLPIGTTKRQSQNATVMIDAKVIFTLQKADLTRILRDGCLS